MLSELEGDDQELAEQIRAKLFTFDDVVQLDDKALQQIFRKIDAADTRPRHEGPATLGREPGEDPRAISPSASPP